MPGIVAIAGDISVNKRNKDILLHIAYISEGGDKINIRKSYGLKKNEQWMIIRITVVVQLLSCVWFSVIPWTTAHQASLSFTISRSLLKLTSIESVMPSSHLILCHPLLLLPPISPSIRVFSNESTLRIRWPEYWSSRIAIEKTPLILVSLQMYWIRTIRVWRRTYIL